MFKSTLLTLTALSAVSLVVAGTTTMPAAAAVKHKIKFTHAVKVKPNVKVKVNSKVRVKTVRPKIRVKINTRQLAKSRVPSCRRYYAGRCRQAPANATAERTVSKTAVAKLSTSNTADLTSSIPTGRNDRFPGIGNDPQYAIALSERAFAGKPWDTQSGYPAFAFPNPKFAAEADRFANMKAAFEAGEAMKEALTLGNLRAAATAEFGLGVPSLEGEKPPSNQDRIGGVPGAGKTGGMLGDNGLGTGPANFPGLGNSHSSDAPVNPWAVDASSAKAGIAGDFGDGHGSAVGKPTVLTNDDGSKTVEQGYSDGTTRVTTTSHGPGGSVTTHDSFNDGDGVTESATTLYPNDGGDTEWTRDVYYRDNPGVFARQSLSVRRGRVTSSVVRPGDSTNPDINQSGGVNERRNPDYIGGGSTCRDIGCIVRGGGKPKGLTMADVANGKTPGAMPQAPDGTQPNRHSSGPAVTQNDVLERYDPDFKGTIAGGKSISPNLCTHSEC